MKRKQIRYSDREEIIKAIDRERAKQTEDRAEALRLDQLADSTFKRLGSIDYSKLSPSAQLDYNDDSVKARNLRREADRIRSRQPGIESRVGRLKLTLAAFDTAPMPFAEESVVLQ